MLLPALLWIVLACDGRLHWDEPAYWYTAAYRTASEILVGDFQPSGIEGFSISRIGHVLELKLVASVFGPGPVALVAIISLYLAMFLGFLWATHRILRILDPASSYARSAVVLVAFTPVSLYLAFTTLAEIPALFLSAVAGLAFLRSLQGRAAPNLLMAIVCLVAVAFTKNHMTLLLASLVLALLLSPGLGFDRRMIVWHASVAVGGALVLFAALVAATPISFERYFAVLNFVTERPTAATTRLLALGLECGTFLAFLPLAFIGDRGPRVRFFALWFGLATLPLLMIGWVEDRYLAINLVPLAGLIQLTIAAAARRLLRLERFRPAAVFGICAVLALLIVPAGMAQTISLHEVRIDQIHRALRRLDSRYGEGRYVLLVPREYADFHYLRFVYPKLTVYDVNSVMHADHRDPVAWKAVQRRNYGPRVIQTFEELAPLGDRLVYFGIESNMTVSNLKSVAAALPFAPARRFLERLVASMNPEQQLANSWMWKDPRIHFSEVLRLGHYVAFEVDLGTAGRAGRLERPRPLVRLNDGGPPAL